MRNDNKTFVMDTLFRLTACVSEDMLFDEIFSQVNKFKNTSSSLFFAGDDNIGKYLVYRHNQETSAKYLFLVHADRLMFKERRMEIFKKDYNNNWFIRGQLDNIISVAIVLYLIKLDYPIDCLFVSREEILESHPQIIEYLNQYDVDDKYKMIDLDIDIDKTVDGDVVNGGYITLSDTAHYMKLDRDMINEIEAYAMSVDIPITKFDSFNPAQAGKYLQTNPSNKKIIYMGLPLTCYHSPEETMSWQTVENTVHLLTGFFQSKNIKPCAPKV
jgi:hypothetical protein